MKKTSLIMCIIMILSSFMCFTAFAENMGSDYWTGTGTQNDPYVISDFQGLCALRDNVNEQGQTYEGVYFVLDADILRTNPDNELNFGRGIGCKGAYNGTISDPVFKGNFDGQGHTVDVSTYSNGNNSNCGMFGYTDGAVIKNIVASTPENITSEKYSKANSCQFAGGIVGYAVNTEISGCKNYEIIVSSQQWSSFGGIVGYAENSVIKNCINYASFDVSNRNASSAGGIAGKIKNSDIINCENYGVAKAASSMGGITGSAEATAEGTNKISGCKNYASLLDSTRLAGGIAGNASRVDIVNCENNAPLASTQTQLGGIIGEINYASVSGCINNAPIDGAGRTGGIIGSGGSVKASNLTNNGKITSSGQNVGGIAGTLSGTMVHLVNNGDVTCSYQGASQGCGGILGALNGYNWGTGNTYLYESVNYGTVTGVNDPAVDSRMAVGGIAGQVNSHHSNMFDCVNYGTSNVAGIAGSLSTNITIKNCLNLGSSPYAGNYYADGSIGYTTYYVDSMTYNDVPAIAAPETGRTATAKTAAELADGSMIETLNSGTDHYNGSSNVWVQGSQYPEIAYFYNEPSVSTSAQIVSITNSTIEYSVTLSESDKAATVIIALYSGDLLTAVKTVDASQSSYTFDGGIDADKATIFVWETLTSAKPLVVSDSKTIE